MKMVSYSQNFEDVILNRVFRDNVNGYFIDVGACHPVNHSVTKHFYDKGWRGINIEPLTSLFTLLCAERRRDINLNVGLSSKEGTLAFYEAPSSLGRSTFSARWCEGWHKHDGCEFVERSVPVTTLAHVCERYADQPIDFLKIDVEGHEREVLEGADFTRWRPRVVLVEGGPEAWEHLLLGANYLFASFDGINRYYVRSEDRQLIPVLSAPVSIIDDFVLYEYLQPINALQVALAEAQSRYEESQRELAEATAEIEAMRSGLARVNDLGTTTLQVARRLQHMAHRHPTLSSLVRRIVRAA